MRRTEIVDGPYLTTVIEIASVPPPGVAGHESQPGQGIAATAAASFQVAVWCLNHRGRGGAPGRSATGTGAHAANLKRNFSAQQIRGH